MSESFISEKSLLITLKSFSSWVYQSLPDFTAGSSFLEDCAQGFAPALFVEKLTSNHGELSGKLKSVVTFRSQKLYNIRHVFDFLEKHCGTPLLTEGGALISADDFVDQDLGACVEFFYFLLRWFLLREVRFQSLSGAAALLEWVRASVSAFPNAPDVESFERSFCDGLALCLLIRAHSASALELSSLSRDNPRHNISLALFAAKSHFEIPDVLDLDAMLSPPVPSKTVILYLTLMFHALAPVKQSSVSSRQVARFVRSKLHNLRLTSDFVGSAKYLVNWFSNMIAEFSNTSAPLANVKEVVLSYKKFVDEERAAAFDLHLGMLKSFNVLQLSSFAHCKQYYTPPTELTLSAVRSLIDRMLDGQFSHERRILSLVAKEWSCFLMARSYSKVGSKFLDWATSLYQEIEKIVISDSLDLSAEETRLVKVDVELRTWTKVCEYLSRLHQQILDSGLFQMPYLEFTPQDFEEVLSDLTVMVSEKVVSIRQLISQENERENIALKFDFVAEELVSWMSRTVGKLHAPWQDYKNTKKMVEDFKIEKAIQDEEIAKLKSLNPQDAGTIEDLYNELQILFAVKETEVNTKDSLEEIRLQYEENSRVLNRWIFNATFRFSSMPFGDTADVLEQEREEISSFQAEFDSHVSSFETLRDLWYFLTNDRNVRSHRDSGFQFPFSGLESRWQSLAKLSDSRRMENDEKMDDFEDIQEVDKGFEASTSRLVESMSLLQDALVPSSSDFAIFKRNVNVLFVQVIAKVEETMELFVQLMSPFFSEKDRAFQSVSAMLQQIPDILHNMLSVFRHGCTESISKAAIAITSNTSQKYVDRILTFLIRTEGSDEKLFSGQNLSGLCDFSRTLGSFFGLVGIADGMSPVEEAPHLRNRLKAFLKRSIAAAADLHQDNLLEQVTSSFHDGLLYIQTLFSMLQATVKSLESVVSTDDISNLHEKRCLLACASVDYVHVHQVNSLLLAAFRGSSSLQRRYTSDESNPDKLSIRLANLSRRISDVGSILSDQMEEQTELDSLKSEYRTKASRFLEKLDEVRSFFVKVPVVRSKSNLISCMTKYMESQEELQILAQLYDNLCDTHRSIKFKHYGIADHGEFCVDFLCDQFNHIRRLASQYFQMLRAHEVYFLSLHSIFGSCADASNILSFFTNICDQICLEFCTSPTVDTAAAFESRLEEMSAVIPMFAFVAEDASTKFVDLRSMDVISTSISSDADEYPMGIRDTKLSVSNSSEKLTDALQFCTSVGLFLQECASFEHDTLEMKRTADYVFQFLADSPSVQVPETVSFRTVSAGVIELAIEQVRTLDRKVSFFGSMAETLPLMHSQTFFSDLKEVVGNKKRVLEAHRREVRLDLVSAEQRISEKLASLNQWLKEEKSLEDTADLYLHSSETLSSRIQTLRAELMMVHKDSRVLVLQYSSQKLEDLVTRVRSVAVELELLGEDLSRISRLHEDHGTQFLEPFPYLFVDSLHSSTSWFLDRVQERVLEFMRVLENDQMSQRQADSRLKDLESWLTVTCSEIDTCLKDLSAAPSDALPGFAEFLRELKHTSSSRKLEGAHVLRVLLQRMLSFVNVATANSFDMVSALNSEWVSAIQVSFSRYTEVEDLFFRLEAMSRDLELRLQQNVELARITRQNSFIVEDCLRDVEAWGSRSTMFLQAVRNGDTSLILNRSTAATVREDPVLHDLADLHRSRPVIDYIQRTLSFKLRSLKEVQAILESAQSVGFLEPPGFIQRLEAVGEMCTLIESELSSLEKHCGDIEEEEQRDANNESVLRHELQKFHDWIVDTRHAFVGMLFSAGTLADVQQFVEERIHTAEESLTHLDATAELAGLKGREMANALSLVHAQWDLLSDSLHSWLTIVQSAAERSALNDDKNVFRVEKLLELQDAAAKCANFLQCLHEESSDSGNLDVNVQYDNVLDLHKGMTASLVNCHELLCLELDLMHCGKSVDVSLSSIWEKSLRAIWDSVSFLWKLFAERQRAEALVFQYCAIQRLVSTFVQFWKSALSVQDESVLPFSNPLILSASLNNCASQIRKYLPLDVSVGMDEHSAAVSEFSLSVPGLSSACAEIEFLWQEIVVADGIVLKDAELSTPDGVRRSLQDLLWNCEQRQSRLRTLSQEQNESRRAFLDIVDMLKNVSKWLRREVLVLMNRDSPDLTSAGSFVETASLCTPFTALRLILQNWLQEQEDAVSVLKSRDEAFSASLKQLKELLDTIETRMVPPAKGTQQLVKSYLEMILRDREVLHECLSAKEQLISAWRDLLTSIEQWEPFYIEKAGSVHEYVAEFRSRVVTLIDDATSALRDAFATEAPSALRWAAISRSLSLQTVFELQRAHNHVSRTFSGLLSASDHLQQFYGISASGPVPSLTDSGNAGNPFSPKFSRAKDYPAFLPFGTSGPFSVHELTAKWKSITSQLDELLYVTVFADRGPLFSDQQSNQMFFDALRSHVWSASSYGLLHSLFPSTVQRSSQEFEYPVIRCVITHQPQILSSIESIIVYSLYEELKMFEPLLPQFQDLASRDLPSLSSVNDARGADRELSRLCIRVVEDWTDVQLGISSVLNELQAHARSAVSSAFDNGLQSAFEEAVLDFQSDIESLSASRSLSDLRELTSISTSDLMKLVSMAERDDLLSWIDTASTFSPAFEVLSTVMSLSARKDCLIRSVASLEDRKRLPQSTLHGLATSSDRLVDFEKLRDVVLGSDEEFQTRCTAAISHIRSVLVAIASFCLELSNVDPDPRSPLFDPSSVSIRRVIRILKSMIQEVSGDFAVYEQDAVDLGDDSLLSPVDYPQLVREVGSLLPVVCAPAMHSRVEEHQSGMDQYGEIQGLKLTLQGNFRTFSQKLGGLQKVMGDYESGRNIMSMLSSPPTELKRYYEGHGSVGQAASPLSSPRASFASPGRSRGKSIVVQKIVSSSPSEFDSPSAEFDSRKRGFTVRDIQGSSEDSAIEMKICREVDTLLRLRQDVYAVEPVLSSLFGVYQRLLMIAPLQLAPTQQSSGAFLLEEHQMIQNAVHLYEEACRRSNSLLQSLRDREGAIRAVDSKLCARLAEELRMFCDDTSVFIRTFQSSDAMTLSGARNSLAVLENFRFRRNQYELKFNRISEVSQTRQDLSDMISDLQSKWTRADVLIQRDLPTTDGVARKVRELEDRQEFMATSLSSAHAVHRIAVVADQELQELRALTSQPYESLFLLNGQVDSDLEFLVRTVQELAKASALFDGQQIPLDAIGVLRDLRYLSMLKERMEPETRLLEQIMELKLVLADCSGTPFEGVNLDQVGLAFKNLYELLDSTISDRRDRQQASFAFAQEVAAYEKQARNLADWLDTQMEVLLSSSQEFRNFSVLNVAMQSFRSLYAEFPQWEERITEISRKQTDLFSKRASVSSGTVCHTLVSSDDLVGRVFELKQKLQEVLRSKELTVADVKSLMDKYSLPVEVIHEYEETFSFLDADKSGFLDIKEIGALISILGESMDPSTVRRIFSAIDKNQDGTISFDEFVFWAKSQFRPIKTTEEILNTLLSMSASPEGLQWDSLKQCMASALPTKELSELEKLVRKRPNGTVDCPALVSDLFSP
eukprot:ANDGO_06795.mRNA.1 Alpha-actinin A